MNFLYVDMLFSPSNSFAFALSVPSTFFFLTHQKRPFKLTFVFRLHSVVLVLLLLLLLLLMILLVLVLLLSSQARKAGFAGKHGVDTAEREPRNDSKKETIQMSPLVFCSAAREECFSLFHSTRLEGGPARAGPSVVF